MSKWLLTHLIALEIDADSGSDADNKFGVNGIHEFEQIGKLIRQQTSIELILDLPNVAAGMEENKE